MSFEKIFSTPSGSERIDDEIPEVEAGLHHTANLYDQDEDMAGEKIDLATGEPIDNSTYNPDAELTILDSTPEKVETAEDRQLANDAAAKWLQENDPDFKA